MPSCRGHQLTCAAVAAVVLGLPAVARADGPGGVLAPEPEPVSTVAAGPLSLTARTTALVGRTSRFRGTAPLRARRRVVRIQQLDATGTRWRAVASARVRANGGFLARWRPARTGSFTLRALLAGSAPATAPALAVTVYAPALATWFGPGFFGRLTACGVPLAPELLGVAHRELPCGTLVTLNHAGRSIVVPVVDRGPFGVPGADWDLTQATAQALGVTETTEIGVLPPVPLPAPAPAPAQPSR